MPSLVVLFCRFTSESHVCAVTCRFVFVRLPNVVTLGCVTGDTRGETLGRELVVIAPVVLSLTTGRFARGLMPFWKKISVLDQVGSSRTDYTEENPVAHRNNYCSTSGGPSPKTGGDPVIHSNCHCHKITK